MKKIILAALLAAFVMAGCTDEKAGKGGGATTKPTTRASTRPS